ncbi:DUF4010 domain-containing protein [Pelomonas sp. SE-A7]|uniref:DUF4010 domain-containing protein n=1 Tax=Pelomonas sp. SE-A7 TaxID=3054953 RepID=UPI00259D23CC|nr:DUF4010 domain-containing protein [Pelomonas sp. SE-A7]MDM4765483.1 DUF4010 domain-containing protein [Pelomonas sp. SE-A7]
MNRESLRAALVVSGGLAVATLLPAESLPWLAGFSPRSLLALLMLILGLQALGQLALEKLGPQLGLALAGLVSGLVSSTATIASMGRSARKNGELESACAAGAVMSTAATWLQALLMLALLAPDAAISFAPAAMAGAAVALGLGAWLTRRQGLRGRANPRGKRAPLQLREALLVTGLLVLVAVLVRLAQQRFGSQGLYGAIALAGLGDAHAPVASLAALEASAQITLDQVRHGVILAIACNSLTRSLVALSTGGWPFARWVMAALAGSALLAAAVLLA